MPRRQRGHPGETEPPENADHEGPAPADLLQMWITGREPQPAATPEPPPEPPPDTGAVDTAPEESAAGEDEPEPAAEEPAHGWASFGHARTAEDVLEQFDDNPWLDVPLGETATPPHPPAEPAKPALLRELDHDEEATEASEPAAYDPDATAVWTLEDVDADGRHDTEPEPIPGLARIPVSEPRPEPAPFGAPLTEAPTEPVDLGWPEEPDDAWEDAPVPGGGLATYAARWGSAEDWQSGDWEPDKWQSAEPPVAEDPPVLEVDAPPVESTPEAAAPEPVDVVAEPVTPEQPTLFEEQVTEPDLPWDPDSTQDFDGAAVEHAEAAPVDDEAVVDVPAREEWYDAGGKLWSSEDGGQTWYTDDGRGWNAETYEDIAPADARRSLPRTATAGSEPQPEDRPSVRERVAATAPEQTDSEDHHGPGIPQHVEYKRRAWYRPLLGILLVVAVVLAVVAIFRAVSQGGQSSIGIAIGVTCFALAFLGGLLSWTPTVVSLNGPILEVARGADGEQFDLRDPDLDIDVDDDTASRNWRATITRPNDTELVIPASAVDPDEFTLIVRHYRGQVEREDHPR